MNRSVSFLSSSSVSSNGIPEPKTNGDDFQPLSLFDMDTPKENAPELPEADKEQQERDDRGDDGLQIRLAIKQKPDNLVSYRAFSTDVRNPHL